MKLREEELLEKCKKEEKPEEAGTDACTNLNAQSLRLFGLHSDVNDAHRAGANRLQNKTNKKVKKHQHNLEQQKLMLQDVQLRLESVSLEVKALRGFGCGDKRSPRSTQLMPPCLPLGNPSGGC